MKAFPGQSDELKRRELFELRLRQKGIALLKTPTLEARKEKADSYPLSFSQQRLWFLDQLEPGSSVYNVPVAVRLYGSLNVRNLELSIYEVVRRHESLRTTFSVKDGQPVQVIGSEAKLCLPLIDTSTLATEPCEAQVQRLALQEGRRAFNLSSGPLMRVLLLRLGPDEHVLLLTMHHIISDHWSRSILVREVTTLYNALETGRPSPLAPLPLQYADYALWQRRWLQGEVLAQQLDYWRKQLADLAPLALPTDFPRPAQQTFRGERQSVELAPELLHALKAVSQREGVTLFMTLLAAFQVLLARYSGQQDIAVGTPMAGRTRREVEGLIGFFINTLVLRSQVRGEQPFRQVLQQVREVCLQAYAHQEVPFEKIVEELHPQRSLSQPPLFQVMFGLQELSQPEEQLGNLTLQPITLESNTTKFDLTLNIIVASELRCHLYYRTDLFEARTITRLLVHWEQLLGDLVAHPERRMADLQLMNDDERKRLLALSTGCKREYPVQSSFTALFEAQVVSAPDRVALTFEEQQLSYGGLYQRAYQLAGCLRQKGIGPEKLVGLLLERSLEMVIGVVGVLLSGGGYVPLDPAAPLDRLAFQVRDARIAALLTQESLCPQAAALEGTGELTLVLGRELDELQPVKPVTGTVMPAATAYMLYTSGSTGTPKGVIVEQSQLINYVYAVVERISLTGNSTFAMLQPLTVDSSVTMLFAALLTGGRLQVISREWSLDAQTLGQYFRREPTDYLKIAPTHLAALLGVEGGELVLPRLRLIIGGEASQWDWARQIQERLADGALYNHYGPTEATVGVLTYAVEKGSESILPGSTPIGAPLANVEAYVLDAFGHPVPQGIVGELYLGGATVARGYGGRPDLTAERFVPDDLSGRPGQRLYRTGDRVRMREDGNLVFIGRTDEQVKLRGYRVELGEIEAVLHEHSQVQQACVVIRETDSAEKMLVGYLVMQDGVPLMQEELQHFMGRKLPEYMIPAILMQVEQLPLTPHGKIDRKKLPEPRTEEKGVTVVEESLSVLEELVAQLWGEVLAQAGRQLGRQANFFALGGHSLLATQLIARVRHVFEREIPLQAIFEAPTLGAFAQYIERELRGESAKNYPPLEARQRPQELPLSFAQQRLWFLDQLQPGNTVYNIPIAACLRGNISFKTLERSLREVRKRHEILRTTFETRGERVFQVIASTETFHLTLADLSSLPLAEREAEKERVMRKEGRRAFNLSSGPLMRVLLLRLGPDEHVLLLTMHHIISDHWSRSILVREVTTLYNALETGRPSPLAPLPLQYADYALWQRRWLQGEVLAQQLDYWRKQLADLAPLALPTDFPRPAQQTFRGERQSVELAPELLHALKAVSQREGVTLFMTLLAAFQVLLARYSGQQDIAVGTPMAGRTRREVEGLIGFFINTLVLRSQVRGEQPFRQVLQQVREVCLQAYAHQEVPFEKIVEELHPQRSLSQPPLFQVMFVLQNTARFNEELTNVTVSLLSQEQTTAKFDLSLTTTETSEGLHCVVEYNTDLFKKETMARLLEYWRTLLAGIALHPEQQIAQLPLLTEYERHQLLIEWNNTQVACQSKACLHTLFEEQAERTPDAVALVHLNEQLTYGELKRRSNQLAHTLRSLAVGPEKLIGLYLERSFEIIIGQLGVLKAGGGFVPLDPASPPDRLAFMLADAQVSVLLTCTHLHKDLFACQGKVLYLDADWPLIAQASDQDLAPRAAEKNIAYVIYTSGSTGRPKGVVIEHSAVINLVLWHQRAFEITSQDRATHLAGLGFDAIIWELWPYLTTGASIALPPDEARISPLLLRDWLIEYAVTITFLPTPLAEKIVEVEWPATVALRTMLTGGDRLQRYPPAALPFELVNNYGPTENAVVAISGVVPSQKQPSMAPPLGRPIDNVQLYVLDAFLQPVALGGPGELYLGGAGVARGYVGRPDLTAERFLPHPWSKEVGARLYKTGDMVHYQPDGTIVFLGRSDQQVKVRGYRIELGEIEAVLKQHPGVQDGVVVLEAHMTNEGGQCLLAYVVRRKGDRESLPAELREYLRERLPSYMLPSAFIELDALPLLASGKVDRRALPPPQEETMGQRETEMELWRPLEDLVATVWQEVLGQRPQQREADFFELGGHSLLATQVVARVRQLLQVEVPLRLVFEEPSVRGFAWQLEQLQRGEQVLAAPPLVPVSRQQRLPLSFAQQRLWFLDQLEPGNTAYTIPLAAQLSGPLHLAALHGSMQDLVQRHEVLRTHFEQQENEPVQCISPCSSWPLPLIDLTGLPLTQRELLARELASQEAQQPFVLARGPLLRTRLLRLQEQEHVLLLSMHHSISDGWSMQILTRELRQLYRGRSRAEAVSLPPLPLQYADYAVWQRQWLQGEVLEQQVSYWLKRLGGMEPLRLPTDHARPAQQSYQGGRYHFALSAELTSGLRELSRQQGVTLFMTLLAGFQIVLGRVSRQQDIVVGADIAGRTHVELEGLIGFFVNLLVLRTDLSGSPSVRQVLERVKETVLGAYMHQEVPFELVVERLDPRHPRDRMPLVQVLFVMQNLPGGQEAEVEGLRMRGVNVEGGTAKFDLALFVQEEGQGMRAGVSYSTALFEDRSIQRLMSRYERVLQQLVAFPDQSVDTLEIAPVAEKARRGKQQEISRSRLKSAKGEEFDL